MVGRTQARVIADQIRLTTLFEIGCIPCMIDGMDGEPATIQHVTSCGRRLEDQHQKTYSACAWHHLGHVPDFVSRNNVELATQMLGPSLAHQRRPYRDRYGTEADLIMIADGLVRMVRGASKRGEFLTQREIGELCRAMHAELVKRRDAG